MSVQKFRSIEEMNKAPEPHSQVPPFERFLRLCAQYSAIAPNRYPRGVFKFRTIEEAQKAREKYTPPEVMTLLRFECATGRRAR